MTWNMRDKVDNGCVSQVMTPKQNCGECGDALKDPFKSDPHDADTWIWTECSECFGPICDSCSDINEHTGDRFCISCLHTPAIAARLDLVQEKGERK